MMFEMVPGDVTPDQILITHHLHYGKFFGPDSLHEELEVLAVKGQHCPDQRRLEGAVLRVGLGLQSSIKGMKPVENFQPHHHPVIHPRLEERLHGRQTLRLAASPVYVKDLVYRLIDEPKPLHHATAHGPQLFHRLLTGRCGTWTVSGSGSPEHFPPQPGGTHAAGAARRELSGKWCRLELPMAQRRDNASGFHQGHEERGVEVLPLIVVLLMVLLHLPPHHNYGVPLCAVTQEA
ncbi:uncharacterized protein [Paramisgurnus dabryanus]|uniref:uncharacterized protein n=1 Tax=Paramisgurnus dabryanus TaxID=90735 RepID=UPI0031F3F95E